METIIIDILNPKVKKLLYSLAELKLINIKSKKNQEFISVLKSIREKSSEPISLDEITEEVEKARKMRLK